MNRRIYIAGDSPALVHAGLELKKNGVSLAQKPEDAQILLYNVPTPAFLRDEIPGDRYIIGGNLNFMPENDARLDLMLDPQYVAANAALTAEAALGLLIPKLECDFSSAPTLIIGWGRIGKCLAALLKSIGIPVTVCARKAEDRAILKALGYEAPAPDALPDLLTNYKCIINTAPARILDSADTDAIKIDLASIQGIPGADVLHARGLPGKYKAEASGKLIAKTILNHREEVF